MTEKRNEKPNLTSPHLTYEKYMHFFIMRYLFIIKSL